MSSAMGGRGFRVHMSPGCPTRKTRSSALDEARPVAGSDARTRTATRASSGNECGPGRGTWRESALGDTGVARTRTVPPIVPPAAHGGTAYFPRLVRAFVGYLVSLVRSF